MSLWDPSEDELLEDALDVKRVCQMCGDEYKGRYDDIEVCDDCWNVSYDNEVGRN